MLSSFRTAKNHYQEHTIVQPLTDILVRHDDADKEYLYAKSGGEVQVIGVLRQCETGAACVE